MSMLPMASPAAHRRRDRGAAALAVVLMLLVVAALAVAYTTRNLVFEQRTGANQYRATQAFEAAEAGLEWALATINAGRVDAACVPLADPDAAGDRWRERMLEIAADTGRVTARRRTDGTPRHAACVFDGGRWRCDCPDGEAPSLPPPAGAGPFPAFVVRFHDDPADPPGVIRVESTGCARLDDAAICAGTAGPGDARATVSVLAALKSALPTPPVAAVTVRGDLDLGTALLHASNTDVATGGITLHVGRTIAGTPLALHGPPGTPADATVFDEPDDGPLARRDAERMFTSVFGMGRETWRLQPAAVFVDCAAACTTAPLHRLARLNPGRALWLGGNLRLDGAATIGTADAPVVLVVDGNVEVTGGGAQIAGLVYTTATTWANTGSLTLRGALVGEGDLALAGGGTTTVGFDAAILARLRGTHGSFVRVPGSWRDF